MPELTIRVGGRSYNVACQAGEEAFLESAAAMLDAEAQTLLRQIGSMPESRMLLMAGLLLADKAAGVLDDAEGREAKIKALEDQIAGLKDAQSVRMSKVLTDETQETLAELSAQAEALADQLEQAVKPAGD